MVLHDAVVVACNGIILTSFQFKELYNYKVILSGETNSSTDVMLAKMNDFEALNKTELSTNEIRRIYKRNI